jgi:hypothetical protein
VELTAVWLRCLRDFSQYECDSAGTAFRLAYFDMDQTCSNA